MALVTLTGTVSAADLNQNFEDKVSNLSSQAIGSNKFHQFDIECLDLTSGTMNGLNEQEFVAPDDMRIWALCLSVWNPDATSRTVTLTLSATDFEGTAVSKYLVDQTVSVSVTATSATEFHATRTDLSDASTYGYLNLIKGITYKMTLTSSSGSAVDRAYGLLLCQQVRRRL